LNHLQWIFAISCETRCDRKTNKRQTKKNDDKNVAIILKIKEITALDPQKSQNAKQDGVKRNYQDE